VKNGACTRVTKKGVQRGSTDVAARSRPRNKIVKRRYTALNSLGKKGKGPEEKGKEPRKKIGTQKEREGARHSKGRGKKPLSDRLSQKSAIEGRAR